MSFVTSTPSRVLRMSPTAGYKRRERYCPGSLHRGEGERFRSVVCLSDRSTPTGFVRNVLTAISCIEIEST